PRPPPPPPLFPYTTLFRSRVRGNPGRRDPQALWVSNILLADNTELLASPGAEPYWSTNAIGDASGFFVAGDLALPPGGERSLFRDRKSTRLNSSHVKISYA